LDIDRHYNGLINRKLIKIIKHISRAQQPVTKALVPEAIILIANFPLASLICKRCVATNKLQKLIPRPQSQTAYLKFLFSVIAQVAQTKQKSNISQ